MILEGHIEIGKGGGTTWSASLTIVSGEVIRLKDKPSETPARFLLDMRDFWDLDGGGDFPGQKPKKNTPSLALMENMNS